MRNKTVVSLSIDSKLLEKIRQLAADDNRSISNYIEQIIKEAVNKETER